VENRTAKTALPRYARIAGVLILLTVVFGPFSMVYIPSRLIVSGDATTTASNIMASEGLFRLGIVSDAFIFLIEIALTGLLYALLKPVSKTLALIAAFSRLAMTIVQGINLLNHFFVLILLSGATYLSVFPPDQVHALVLLFLNAHESVVLIWGLFFGLHLAVLGYLVYTSGYLPRMLGVVLSIVAFCYLTQSLGTILLPEYKALFTSVGFLAIIEIAFPLWLLIKGVNIQPLDTRAPELA
jgi:hypothetical protein